MVDIFDYAKKHDVVISVEYCKNTDSYIISMRKGAILVSRHVPYLECLSLDAMLHEVKRRYVEYKERIERVKKQLNL